jgi:hypothetical protein
VVLRPSKDLHLSLDKSAGPMPSPIHDPLAGLRRPAPVYSWMLVGDAGRRWSSASKVLSTLGGSGGSRVHLMQPIDEDLVDVRRAFFLYPMSAAR